MFSFPVSCSGHSPVDSQFGYCEQMFIFPRLGTVGANFATEFTRVTKNNLTRHDPWCVMICLITWLLLFELFFSILYDPLLLSSVITSYWYIIVNVRENRDLFIICRFSGTYSDHAYSWQKKTAYKKKVVILPINLGLESIFRPSDPETGWLTVEPSRYAIRQLIISINPVSPGRSVLIHRDVKQMRRLQGSGHVTIVPTRLT